MGGELQLPDLELELQELVVQRKFTLILLWYKFSRIQVLLITTVWFLQVIVQLHFYLVGTMMVTWTWFVSAQCITQLALTPSQWPLQRRKLLQASTPFNPQIFYFHK